VNDYNDDEEWDREAAEEEADRQRKAEPAPTLSQDEFLAWRSPRKVSLQATRLDNPLWHWLVRTRWDAYNANKNYAGPSSFDVGPMWCFQRFGKSETLLPDGQIVHIGGEHEDHYDSDFFIYNDVIVIDSNGEIAIYGYPVEDFPPTDFHSATLVGETIFIIGCLGYPKRRVPDTTPVYKLALGSMSISQVETHGEPPGWIYGHSATLADDGQSIVVSGGERWLSNDFPTSENIDSWSLNTLTGEWHRLTQHNWQHWTIHRIDRKPSRLWDVRQALWHRDHAHLGLESNWKFDDVPDFAALEMLYRLDEESPLPAQLYFNVFAVVIDGLTVRFKEDRFWIEAIIEGQLAKERLGTLQRRTLELVERLEASTCVIEGLDDDDFQT
jgi:hypothetical protein